jgi:hypothetical protein
MGTQQTTDASGTRAITVLYYKAVGRCEPPGTGREMDKHRGTGETRIFFLLDGEISLNSIGSVNSLPSRPTRLLARFTNMHVRDPLPAFNRFIFLRLALK